MKRASLFCFVLAFAFSLSFSQSPLFPELRINQDETIAFLDSAGFLDYSIVSDELIHVTRGSNLVEYRFEPNFGLSQVVMFRNIESRKMAIEKYQFVVKEFIVECFRNVENPQFDEVIEHGDYSTSFTVDDIRTEILLLKKGDMTQLKIIKSDKNLVHKTAMTDLVPALASEVVWVSR